MQSYYQSSSTSNAAQGSRLSKWLGKEIEEKEDKENIPQVIPSTHYHFQQPQQIDCFSFPSQYQNNFYPNQFFYEQQQQQEQQQMNNFYYQNEMKFYQPIPPPIPSTGPMMMNNNYVNSSAKQSSTIPQRTSYATILPTPDWNDDQLAKLEQQFQTFMKRPNERQMQQMADSVDALYADIESWVRKRRMLIRKQKQRNQRIREHLEMYQ
ncbi:hypothetical protein SNEBB_000468 [Seison nebaliae]|nr:hypothetical protein SNEBB_000468 [Seison nebaliae]